MQDLLEDPRARKGALAGLAAVALIAIVAIFDLGPCADELTVEEFIAEGDAICTEVHDEFRELQGQSPRTPSEAAELASALIELADEEREAIADLGAPDEISADVERYLNARERGIERLRAGRDAAEEADPAAYERAQARLADTQLDRYAIAKRIGFRECSKPLVGKDELERQAEPPASSDPDAPPQVDNPAT